MLKKIIRREHPRQNHMVWDGFRVAQYIPWYGKEMSNDTSPFLMLDYNAPWKVEPQRNGHRPGVGFHPHRGFETVTIVYSGEVEHKDTAWNGGIIGADEVQWMTAASGLLHNEFMTDSFSLMGWIQHVAQLWVNLPAVHKMSEPKYQALTKNNIPEVVFQWWKVRVIAGEFQDVEWVASTFSPIELYDIRFDVGFSTLDFTIPEGYNTMILVSEGSVIINEKILDNGDMVYLSQDGTEIHIESRERSKVLVMAGKPLNESVAHYGPFVMNTQTEIMQAFQDFRDGKMGDVNL